jgi:DNA-binding CsgD family transcriptional regulator
MEVVPVSDLSTWVLDGARQGATLHAFHRHLLEGLRSLVGCDGASIRPGPRWPGSAAYYLDEETRFTDGYVRHADRYRPGIARWCALSRGDAAFIDTEIYSGCQQRRIPVYCEVLHPCRVRSIMGCPLRCQGEIVGLILLFRCGLGQPFRAEQAEAITRHLSGIALAELSMVRALSAAGEPPRRRDALSAALPSRHARVLDQLLTGRSEKEIASALALSPRTVHKYTEQVFRALGARSRPELMARFVGR